MDLESIERWAREMNWSIQIVKDEYEDDEDQNEDAQIYEIVLEKKD